jgi:hypothetical protein
MGLQSGTVDLLLRLSRTVRLVLPRVHTHACPSSSCPYLCDLVGGRVATDNPFAVLVLHVPGLVGTELAT